MDRFSSAQKPLSRDVADSSGPVVSASGGMSSCVDGAVQKALWRLGPFLALMFATSILDRSNVGFAKEALRADVNIGDAAYAFGAGIFFIGYALFEIPSNLILHRIGAKVWLSRIMVTWGLASALMMFVSGPVSFYCIRFLVGLAEAGFSPGVILFSTYWFPSSQRGKFLGIYYIGLPAALTAGSAISGFIMDRMKGYLTLHNWQWMFLIEGGWACVVGIAAYFMLPSKPADALWLTRQESDELTEAIEAERSEQGSHAPKDSLAALKDGRVMRFVLIYFAIQVGIYGVIFYLPSRIATALGSQLTFEAGLLAAIPWLCALIALRPLTGLADRVYRHRWFATWLLLLAAMSTALSTQATHISSIVVAFSFATIGFVVVQPLFWTLPAAYLRDTAAATGIALIGACGNLGGFVAPTLKTAAEQGFHNSSAGMLALSVVTCGGVLLLATQHNHAERRKSV